MAFRCEACAEVQPDGSRPTRVVIHVRNKEYPQREYRDRTGRHIRDQGGFGKEIAREITACTTCAAAAAVVPPVA